MQLDLELYRRDVITSLDPRVRISVIDINPALAQGTMVFQTDWDDFTYLFYGNTANNYLVGLDPTYLELANPHLWNQWVDITRGRIAKPSQIIVTAFGANYVVSDRHHQDFEKSVRNDTNMQIVYRDQYSFVWLISVSTTAVNEAK